MGAPDHVPLGRSDDTVRAGCVRVMGDSDGDGIGDDMDVCPEVANATQIDSDGDAAGEPCDNRLLLANPSQLDADSDGLGDACGFAWGQASPPAEPEGRVSAADLVYALALVRGDFHGTRDQRRWLDVAPFDVVTEVPRTIMPRALADVVVGADDVETLVELALGRATAVPPR